MGRRVYDWAEVQAYHDRGHGFVECQRRFGFSHTAWIKAVKRGKLRIAPTPFPNRRRYDWAAVQAYYDEGHGFRQCRAKFGFCAAAWTKAVKRFEIKPRPPGMPVVALLAGSRRNRTHVKGRLLKAGLLVNRCSVCGITEWLGSPLSMHLDHINGAGKDNRLENLRMLCPNCHSQTDTYGGRNMKRRRRELQDPRPVV